MNRDLKKEYLTKDELRRADVGMEIICDICEDWKNKKIRFDKAILKLVGVIENLQDLIIKNHGVTEDELSKI